MITASVRQDWNNKKVRSIGLTALLRAFNLSVHMFLYNQTVYNLSTVTSEGYNSSLFPALLEAYWCCCNGNTFTVCVRRLSVQWGVANRNAHTGDDEKCHTPENRKHHIHYFRFLLPSPCENCGLVFPRWLPCLSCNFLDFFNIPISATNSSFVSVS